MDTITIVPVHYPASEPQVDEDDVEVVAAQPERDAFWWTLVRSSDAGTSTLSGTEATEDAARAAAIAARDAIDVVEAETRIVIVLDEDGNEVVPDEVEDEG